MASWVGLNFVAAFGDDSDFAAEASSASVACFGAYFVGFVEAVCWGSWGRSPSVVTEIEVISTVRLFQGLNTRLENRTYYENIERAIAVAVAAGGLDRFILPVVLGVGGGVSVSGCCGIAAFVLAIEPVVLRHELIIVVLII